MIYQLYFTSSVDIPMSEGPVNLNWNPIMKTINESPYDFFQQGGWNFLGGAGGEEVCFFVNAHVFLLILMISERSL
jgi:nucleosome binding factor SPN SPT16 subunit